MQPASCPVKGFACFRTEYLTDGLLGTGGDKAGPSTTSREQTSAEQLPRREAREKELHIALDGLIEMGDANEVLNERAVTVMRRMSDKLTGRDFMQDGLLGEQPCRQMAARILSTYNHTYKAGCWQDPTQAQSPWAASRTVQDSRLGPQQHKPMARPHSRHSPQASSCTMRAELLGEEQNRAVAQLNNRHPQLGQIAAPCRLSSPSEQQHRPMAEPSA